MLYASHGIQQLRLKNILDPIKRNYDYIIIDNHPDIDLLISNALMCSDMVIIPVNPDADNIMFSDSIEGMNLTLTNIKEAIDEGEIAEMDFRILLTMTDRTKASQIFEDYLRSFDVTSDLRLQFNRMVEDVCDHVPMGRDERLIIHMMLLRGFKGKEVAAEMGVTPAAISQKYKKLKDDIIVPYFRQNFDMDLEMPEVFEVYGEPMAEEAAMPPMGMESIKLYMPEDMEQKRTTPEHITSLQPNEIFVFGSNLRGMHGGGAAYVALRKFGAIMGQGVGLQGQSYAIPTMQGGVETIKPYVDEFIQFAKEHPNLTFLVTRIGCGIAGFTDEEISPLFEKAHDVENIVLPAGW